MLVHTELWFLTLSRVSDRFVANVEEGEPRGDWFGFFHDARKPVEV
jgi:hypothetical protein